MIAVDVATVDLEANKAKLTTKDVVFVFKRDIPGADGQVALYFTAQTVTGLKFLIELKFKAGLNMCKVTVRSSNKALSELCKTAVAKLLA